MPIYAYKCTACGHAEDILQKMSDPRLTECPQCKQQTYAKQVTAAGFQLKGSGWYVTDFRNNSGGTSKTSEAAVPTSGAEAVAGASTGDSASPGGDKAPSAPAAAVAGANAGSGSSSGAAASGSAQSGSSSGSSSSSTSTSSPATSGKSGGSSSSSSGA